MESPAAESVVQGAMLVLESRRVHRRERCARKTSGRLQITAHTSFVLPSCPEARSERVFLEQARLRFSLQASDSCAGRLLGRLAVQGALFRHSAELSDLAEPSAASTSARALR